MSPPDPNGQAALPGTLVVAEGIDGAGKSTLARGLAEGLRARGHRVILTAEPTHGVHGRALRRALRGEERPSLEEEYRLFVADRREHVEEVILPGLREGAVVVCDRYYLSTMAYQGARGLEMEAIREENEAFAPRPHLALVVELPVEEALARIRRSRGLGPDLMEEEEYLRRVAARFREMDLPFVVRLDGRLPPQRLLQEALRAVEERCPAVGRKDSH